MASDHPPPNPQNRISFERERGVTEIALRRGLAHFQIRTTPAERLGVIRALADAAIPIFLIKLGPDGFSFTLRQEHARAAVTLLRQRSLEPEVLEDLALVSIIAGAMRDLSGVISQIYDALIEARVSVRQTGDAYNAVHCLVAGESAERAAAALRQRFGLPPAHDLPPVPQGDAA